MQAFSCRRFDGAAVTRGTTAVCKLPGQRRAPARDEKLSLTDEESPLHNTQQVKSSFKGLSCSKSDSTQLLFLRSSTHLLFNKSSNQALDKSGVMMSSWWTNWQAKIGRVKSDE